MRMPRKKAAAITVALFMDKHFPKYESHSPKPKERPDACSRLSTSPESLTMGSYNAYPQTIHVPVPQQPARPSGPNAPTIASVAITRSICKDRRPNSPTANDRTHTQLAYVDVDYNATDLDAMAWYALSPAPICAPRLLFSDTSVYSSSSNYSGPYMNAEPSYSPIPAYHNAPILLMGFRPRIIQSLTSTMAIIIPIRKAMPLAAFLRLHARWNNQTTQSRLGTNSVGTFPSLSHGLIVRPWAC